MWSQFIEDGSLNCDNYGENVCEIASGMMTYFTTGLADSSAKLAESIGDFIFHNNRLKVCIKPV